jgi:hypothetical protein
VILSSLDDRAPDFGGYHPASVELSQRSRTTQRLAPPGRVARQAEMATEPENPRLAGRHLQVLRVLADAPHGCDVNALLTRGVKLETMADLIQGELATVRVETVEERGSKIEFACVRITDAGRRALQKPRPPEAE